MPAILKKSDGSKFEVGEGALVTMQAYIQDTSEKTEAGGVLLGRHIIGSTDIVVDEVTGPMAGDQRSRWAFHRARRGHQTAIDRAWRKSGGTSLYLGGWHTHAEQDPTPSGVDLDDWKHRARGDTFDGDALYFVIMGTRTLRAWEVVKETSDCTLIGEYQHNGGSHVEDKHPA